MEEHIAASHVLRAVVLGIIVEYILESLVRLAHVIPDFVLLHGVDARLERELWS